MVEALAIDELVKRKAMDWRTQAKRPPSAMESDSI